MAEVDVSQLRPNSHKYRSEQEEKAASEAKEKKKEKLGPVVSKDKVVSTKKPLSKKFADTFIKQDVDDVKNYLLMDVVIPGIKNLLLDGLSMIFFGEVQRRRGGNFYERDRNRTSYSSYYRGSSVSRSSRDRGRRYEEDDKINYRNIVLRERRDAEDVIEQLRRRIQDQGSASVADLFDLIDVAGKYTDNNWGWTSDRQIGIRRVSDGYLIDVDEAEYLD